MFKIVFPGKFSMPMAITNIYISGKLWLVHQLDPQNIPKHRQQSSIMDQWVNIAAFVQVL